MNPNIARIIAFLAFRQKHNNLCSVGQARLRWWRRNGRKFRSVKAALRTWDVDNIKEWFEYAGVAGSGSASDIMHPREAIKFLEVEDLFDSAIFSSNLPEPFKSRVKKLEADAGAWLDRTAKAAMLNQSERALIGYAATKQDRWL